MNAGLAAILKASPHESVQSRETAAAGMKYLRIDLHRCKSILRYFMPGVARASL
jgi:hypothetical protein